MEGKNILEELYNISEESMVLSDKYKEISKKFDAEKKKFLSNLENQNEKTFEDLCDIIYEMDNELSKKLFCKGFSIAVNLFIEVLTNSEERDV